MREHAVAENPRILLGRKAFQQRRKAFQHFLEQAKKVCHRYYKPKKRETSGDFGNGTCK